MSGSSERSSPLTDFMIRTCDYCGAGRRGVVEVTMDWNGGRAQIQMCTGCREILAGGDA
jgi:hypothetical protein